MKWLRNAKWVWYRGGFAFGTLPPSPIPLWVWYRGDFAVGTLNIALNNIQHATHRPSVSEHDDLKKRPIKRYKSKGPVPYPH